MKQLLTNMDNELNKTIQIGDIDTVKNLILSGLDVNFRADIPVDIRPRRWPGWKTPPDHYEEYHNAYSGLTPLMMAARSAAAGVEILDCLLASGADLRAVSSRGVTAAWYAASRSDRGYRRHNAKNQSDKLRYLLDAGLNPNETTASGRSLLCEACCSADPTRVRILLERGASPTVDEATWRQLIDRRRQDDEWGVLPIPNDYSHETQGLIPVQIPLFAAAIFGPAESVRLLIEYGANIQEREWCGTNALSYASDIEIAKILYDAGIRTNALTFDEYEYDSLDISLHNSKYDKKYLKLSDYLLTIGFKIENRGKKTSRLFDNCIKRNWNIVKWLLDHDALSSSDSTLILHELSNWQWRRNSTYSFAKIVRILVSYGISIDFTDNHGRSALHISSSSNTDNAQYVKILLRHGSSPNLEDNYGQTPLHLASGYGNIRCVVALLSAGADPLHKMPSEGFTPLDYAYSYIEDCENHYLVEHTNQSQKTLRRARDLYALLKKASEG